MTEETMLANFLLWLRVFHPEVIPAITTEQTMELAREWLAFRDKEASDQDKRENEQFGSGSRNE